MTEARREPVNYRYDAVNWDFIHRMAQIAHYAEGKYGRAENYVDGELTGEKSPINHICEHLRSYVKAENHDHFDGPEWHLVVIAYNAMMEFYYFQQRGRECGELYRPAAWAAQPNPAEESPAVAPAPPPLAPEFQFDQITAPSLFEALFGRMKTQ